jgi:hypothetical protein
MTKMLHAMPLLLALLAVGTAQAQPLPLSVPSPDVLLSTQFVSPLTYEAALARIDQYLDEQVGRKAAVAFPQIAPHRHYDLWHDMWVSFEASGAGVKVTMRRSTDGSAERLVKGWMRLYRLPSRKIRRCTRWTAISTRRGRM